MISINDIIAPAFGQMLLTNVTALDAGILCIPRVLNCLPLDKKVCTYLALNEVPVGW